MKKELADSVVTNDREVEFMPTIELIEYEKAAYVKEMKEYLQNLKKMPYHEAKEKAQSNLIGCKIIQENGEFAEQYKYSRKGTKHKR